MGYQDALLFLQNLPTADWNEEDIDMLLQKSYEMKQLYHYNTRLVNSGPAASKPNSH